MKTWTVTYRMGNDAPVHKRFKTYNEAWDCVMYAIASGLCVYLNFEEIEETRQSLT